jgi:uncharacterized membrane protein (UPF0127 family)
MITIYQKVSKLIKNFSLILSISLLFPMNSWADGSYQISNPTAQKVTLRLALTRQENAHGLSGLKSSEFTNDEGMLFVNAEMDKRQFWMPDTYFNLDIIFLDKDLKIIGLEKDVPAHPGMAEPPAIYRTKAYVAQFILETKTGAPFSKKLKVGDKLKWISPTSLSEIVLKTRRPQ